MLPDYQLKRLIFVWIAMIVAAWSLFGLAIYTTARLIKQALS